MTATLFAVQNIITAGQLIGPGAVFTTDDASGTALLASGQAATSVGQETADAATSPSVPAGSPELSTG